MSVFALLSKFCKSKATGLDNISAKLLRECPDLLDESLTHRFNQSLMTGIFPDIRVRAARFFDAFGVFQKGPYYSFPTLHYNNQNEIFNEVRCRIRLIAPMAQAIFLEIFSIWHSQFIF